ncbi:MAG: hypothetical protein M1815_002529 [Lichina confinis]|nr:MAG: hypothetical protein M1815_002529 [Lichina confinis]
MISRILPWTLPEARCFPTVLPPTFLLPSRSRFFNSTTPIVDSDGGSTAEGLGQPITSHAAHYGVGFPATPQSRLSTSTSTSSPRNTTTRPETTSLAPSPTPHESLRTLLPLLKTQQSHYITIHIHARPYLLTVGDVLRLPFHMPGVVPGDMLRLDRASMIGSRDYTLKGAPYVDENLFECRARVIGVESEPMKIELRTKPRQRKVKRIKSKHKYTVLRLAELKINSLEEIGR